jgi:DNA invertase Pin-like site-specific DNA recombinase
MSAGHETAGYPIGKEQSAPCRPEGIAKANAAGVYKGRPASIDTDKVRRLKDEGMGPSAIAKQLKIGRASVYRVLGGAEERQEERRARG